MLGIAAQVIALVTPYHISEDYLPYPQSSSISSHTPAVETLAATLAASSPFPAVVVQILAAAGAVVRTQLVAQPEAGIQGHSLPLERQQTQVVACLPDLHTQLEKAVVVLEAPKVAAQAVLVVGVLVLEARSDSCRLA